MKHFEKFLDEWFRLFPDQATERGYKKYNDLPMSFERDRFEEFAKLAQSMFADAEQARVADRHVDQGIDVELFKGYLRTATFFPIKLGWLESNPLFYIQKFMDSLENLDSRFDLPEEERLRCLIARLSGTRGFVDQILKQVNDPMEPYFEVGMAVWQASIDQLRNREDCETHPSREFRDAIESALRSLDRGIHQFSKREKNRRPFAPMGEELYRELLRDEHGLDFDLKMYEQMAQKRLEEADREIAEIEPHEKEQEDSVVFEAVSREEIWKYYQNELEYLKRFVEERALVRIPPGKLVLTETPAYLRAFFPGAAYQPPPSFGYGKTGYFFVRPLPDKLDRKQQEYYREFVNLKRFRTLASHEAYPGHHVQFLHASAQPRLLRKMRDNDVMIEGWAFYAEHLMKEQGLFDEFPSTRPMRAIRFRALRVLLDVAIHTGKWTLEEAKKFMKKSVGESSGDWVEKEVHRYACEPSQALSYLVGKELILQLRDRWFERKPQGKLFDFHNELLAEGSIPLPLIFKKMGIPLQG